MRVEYTGRRTEVPAEVRRLGDRKLRKLARVLRGITDVHVILAVDKHRHIAEVTVHSPRLDLTATEESGDLAVSLRTVMDKLIRQAERHMGKLRERKRRTPTRATARAPEPARPPASAGGDGRPRVIRTRRFAVKPMTVEEAALEMGTGDEGPIVFRDAATERVNVLYRRKDGNLGLIEAEA